MITKKTIFAAAAAAMMALPTGALAQNAQSAQNSNASYTQENPNATNSRANGTTGTTQNRANGNARSSATGANAATVDDKTMASFAKVHPEVEKINRTYAERIRKETNVESRNRLAAQANREIETLIGDSDISLQEYNRLSMLIQQDADLQNQYHRALNK